jgi:hypothetical protein
MILIVTLQRREKLNMDRKLQRSFKNDKSNRKMKEREDMEDAEEEEKEQEEEEKQDELTSTHKKKKTRLSYSMGNEGKQKDYKVSTL